MAGMKGLSAERSPDAWRRDVLDPALAKSPERRSSFATISGQPIERLYTADGLADLLATATAVARREPTFAEVSAFASGWGDATLGYLNDVGCADPLTGLSTQAHLRDRVSGLYRGASAGRHALVVAESRTSSWNTSPLM